jgi:WD40 repeat protein
MRFSVNDLAFSPDGKLLVATSIGGVGFPDDIVVWHTDTYSEPAVVQSDTEGARSMCFVPGTHKLITGGNLGIYLWDLDKLTWPADKKQEAAGRK